MKKLIHLLKKIIDLLNYQTYKEINLSKKEINMEATKLVYLNRIPSLFSVAIVSFIPLIAGIIMRDVESILLVNSLLWIYVIVNSILCVYFNKSNISDGKIIIWEYYFYIQHIILALLFNLTFMHLHFIGFQYSPLYLLIVLMSFSAGSVSAFHQLKLAPPLFMVSGMIPTIIFFQRYYVDDIFVLLMLVLFVVFMSMISFKQHKNWMLSLAVSKELEVAKNEAEHLSNIDLLTKLYNRRAFYKIAEKTMINANQGNETIVIAMMDIDYFKKINDTYGHLIGDEVLIKISEKLLEKQKNNITIGRFGGEEFVFIFTNEENAKVFEYIEYIRLEINKILFCENKFTVTSSFGIASKREEKESLSDLIKKADDALYFAKEQGRNRTVCYDN